MEKWFFILILVVATGCQKNTSTTSARYSEVPDTRRFVRAAFNSVAFERHLHSDLGYRPNRYYFYLVEDQGRNYLEVADSTVLWSKGKHQMPSIQNRLYRFSAQLTEEGKVLLQYDGVYSGRGSFNDARLVIDELCNGSEHHCQIEKSAGGNFSEKSISFDPEGPTDVNFTRLCSANPHDKDLCDVFYRADEKVIQTEKVLNVLYDLVVKDDNRRLEPFQRTVVERWKVETKNHRKAFQEGKRKVIQWSILNKREAFESEKMHHDLLFRISDLESTQRFIKSNLEKIRRRN